MIARILLSAICWRGAGYIAQKASSLREPYHNNCCFFGVFIFTNMAPGAAVGTLFKRRAALFPLG